MAIQFRSCAGGAAYVGYSGGEWIRNLFYLRQLLLQYVLFCVVLDSRDQGFEFGEVSFYPSFDVKYGLMKNRMDDIFGVTDLVQKKIHGDEEAHHEIHDSTATVPSKNGTAKATASAVHVEDDLVKEVK